jgi:hypothetical protein
MDNTNKSSWSGQKLWNEAPPGLYRKIDGGWHVLKTEQGMFYWIDRKGYSFMEPVKPYYGFMGYRQIEEGAFDGPATAPTA